MKKVNVLIFPGTNCGIETARAISEAGFSSKILRWNSCYNEIEASDGLVIPGGFSFEDRGRSGVIAAADPVSRVIRKMGRQGKPILGICNGAQILIESGLIPGYRLDKIEMSLARNKRQKNGEILGSGYYHDFIYVTPGETKCAWTHFSDVIRLPIAHGEGRFMASEAIRSALIGNEQDALLYCDKDGQKDSQYPVNPNGSDLNLAAVCNPEGNVMAMMPHPERVQDGQKIFQSLHRFFEEKETRKPPVPPPAEEKKEMRDKKTYPIELYVSMKITDNTEKSLEAVARKVFDDPEISLTRRTFWGVQAEGDLQGTAEQLIASEEFLNENKESAMCKIGENWFAVEDGRFTEIEAPAQPAQSLLAMETDDVLGLEKEETLQKHVGLSVSVSSGILWELSKTIPEEKVLDSALFGNPVSWEVARV